MTNWSEVPKNANLLFGSRVRQSREAMAPFANSASEPAAIPTIGTRDISRFLRQNWATIAVLSSASVLLAIIYTSLTAPTFKASASVMFDPSVSSALLKDERWQSVETSAKIDSQVEIIKSGRVATAVVQQLSLDQDPDFAGARGSMFSPSSLLLPSPNTSVEKAVVGLTNRLAVRRIGQSTALEISFVSGSAEKSAKVANAVAQAYIDIALQDRSSMAQNGAKWLEKRLDYLRGQAFTALQEAENFKAVGSGTAVDSRVKLAELQSVAQTYRQMYDSFLLKYFETEQFVSYPVADARPLSAATAGLADKSPKKAAIIAFAAFAGAFAGICLALLRQSLDHTIKSPIGLAADSRATYCGSVEHVGVLKAHSGPDRKVQLGSVLAALSRYSLSRPEREDLRLATLITQPPAAMRDSLRRVRSTIFAALPPTAPRMIGVSSVNSGEGKTAIAANLAALCAASGYRTLMIDACVTNPSASRILSPKGAPGLCDAIQSGQSSKIFVLPDVGHGFAFLPSGSLTSAASLSDFLDGPGKRLGFDEIRSAFEIIIVDLPALSASSDVMSMSSLLDGLILVAEYGSTRQDKYQDEINRFATARPLFIGSVLNKADPDVSKDA